MCSYVDAVNVTMLSVTLLQKRSSMLQFRLRHRSRRAMKDAIKRRNQTEEHSVPKPLIKRISVAFRKRLCRAPKSGENVADQASILPFHGSGILPFLSHPIPVLHVFATLFICTASRRLLGVGVTKARLTPCISSRYHANRRAIRVYRSSVGCS